jgi:hypothetical protein
MFVSGVPVTKLIQPGWLALDNGVHRQCLSVLAMREGIGYSIFLPFAVANAVTQTKQLSESLLLPNRGESLLFKVHETFLISSYQKLLVLQIGMPLLHCHKDFQAFFFVSGQALVLFAQRFAHVGDRMTILLQNSSYPSITRVGVHHKWLGEIR